MDDFFKYEKKIIPEMIELLQKRYDILKAINYNEPIGRRKLSLKINMSERIIRNEIEVLKMQNLVKVNLDGIIITDEGKEILKKLEKHVYKIKGLEEIEHVLKEKLNLKKVIVVPGDYDLDSEVIKELGRVAGIYIRDQIVDGDIIALTGGSTIREVVNNFPSNKKFKDVLIVPGRGGLGQVLETQSNTIVEILANKIGASYKLLYVPENLSFKTQDAILEEKAVREVVNNIKQANILIHGIGIAEEMANKRGLDGVDVEKIVASKAVGEIFGLYFNREGEIVYRSGTIGIKFNDINSVPLPIAVACGKRKAQAIMSIKTELNENRVLIIDEGLANEILNMLNKN